MSKLLNLFFSADAQTVWTISVTRLRVKQMKKVFRYRGEKIYEST